jgi:diguanylate cyclase (GGDEF)-like protein
MTEGQSSILIVDDDKEDLALVERALRPIGSELFSIRDPHEVVPTVYQRRPDVVILDALLPGLSGFDLCKQIKGDPQLKGTQVLILTGVYLRQQYRNEAVQQFKADAFLTKPFRPPELQRIVAQLLSRRTRTPQSNFLKRIGLPVAAEPRKRGLLGRLFSRGAPVEEAMPERIAPIVREEKDEKPSAAPVKVESVEIDPVGVRGPGGVPTFAPAPVPERREPEPEHGVASKEPVAAPPPGPEPTPEPAETTSTTPNTTSPRTAVEASPEPAVEERSAAEPAPDTEGAAAATSAESGPEPETPPLEPEPEPEPVPVAATPPVEPKPEPALATPALEPEPAAATPPAASKTPVPSASEGQPAEIAAEEGTSAQTIAVSHSKSLGSATTVSSEIAREAPTPTATATYGSPEATVMMARESAIAAGDGVDGAERAGPTAAEELETAPLVDSEKFSWIEAQARTQEMTVAEAAALARDPVVDKPTPHPEPVEPVPAVEPVQPVQQEPIPAHPPLDPEAPKLTAENRIFLEALTSQDGSTSLKAEREHESGGDAERQDAPRVEQALPPGPVESTPRPVRRRRRMSDVPVYEEEDFFTELKRELSMCKRVDRPLTLIVIQVGDLSQIVELFGREYRDAVLWHVAEQATASLREVDLVGMMSSQDRIAMTAFASDRYGGGRIVSRMRKAVEKNPFPVGAEIPPIIPVLQFGMATFPQDGGDVPCLLQKAEAELGVRDRDESTTGARPD